MKLLKNLLKSPMFVIGMCMLLVTLVIAFFGPAMYRMRTGINIKNVSSMPKVGSQYDTPGTKYMLDGSGGRVRAGYTINEDGGSRLVLESDGSMIRVFTPDTAGAALRAELFAAAGIREQQEVDSATGAERLVLLDSADSPVGAGISLVKNGKKYALDSRGNLVYRASSETLSASEQSEVFAKAGIREHTSLLGADNHGDDYVALLIMGLRSSLWVGLLAGLIATTLGTLIGIYGGFKGGIVDDILSVLTNLFIVIPQFVVLVLISSSMGQGGRSLTLIAVIIGLTSWTWSARSVRAQAAALKSKDHISLARLNGDGTFRVLFVHILPYLFSYVFMVFIMTVASGILSESAISMIGLGPNDTVSLGVILNDAKNNGALTQGIAHAFLPATVIITLIVFALYLINTSMEGVFNPRLRK